MYIEIEGAAKVKSATSMDSNIYATIDSYITDT